MAESKALLDLRRRIRARQATIGVFGAGYVGLPLACAFAEAGFKTIAGDNNAEKLMQIRKGSSYVEDPYVKRNLRRLVSSGRLQASQDLVSLAHDSDIEIVTVPTPLTKQLEPDLSYVTSVSETIARELRPGQFVILESSVYPGVTDEVVKPILQKDGLKAGVDFGLAHSPERIDYGNPKSVLDIPKVVGGVTPFCTKVACELYSRILRAKLVPVSDARTAEMTKMVENTYRYVNIALANELAIACEKIGVDIYDVITAAATKPFGFQPFYPGPGVGGHCIPKDPHYLNYKTRQVGARLGMVELSTSINEGMTRHIIQMLTENYRARGVEFHGKKAVILGLAFKPDISDTRRSPAIALTEQLIENGVHVTAYDPYAKSIETRNGITRSSEALPIAAKGADLVFLVTPHKVFRKINLKELRRVMNPNAMIFDTRGFWTRMECEVAGFKYLCIGRPQKSSSYQT